MGRGKMIEIEEKVRESKVLMAMLDEYFRKNNYQIRQYHFEGYSGDDPNVDFRMIVDLPKLKGVSFGVGGVEIPKCFALVGQVRLESQFQLKIQTIFGFLEDTEMDLRMF